MPRHTSMPGVLYPFLRRCPEIEDRMHGKKCA
uniref:Uncharacterized protein n=1 Tax=Anguilla anguilla TaxID=7936 RepID=A0A0E9XT79_ANGAN